MKIILVRHGPPKFDNTKYIESAGLQEALAEYAESVVTEEPRHEIPALRAGSESQIAVCSELVRSRSSAALLGFGGVTASPLLNESLLPYPDVLPFRMPWRIVLVFFRIAWLLGYKQNARGIRKDRHQARQAGGWLIDLAQTHGEVVVFGHGIMNRLIVKQLTNDGWNNEITFGRGYWSYCVVSHERQVKAQ